MWTGIKCGSSASVLCVTYFPLGNTPDKAEDDKALQKELIQNIAEIQNRYNNILVFGALETLMAKANYISTATRKVQMAYY